MYFNVLIIDDFVFMLIQCCFRLALKAFNDQKRRFFPHLDDEVLRHLHDGEPGVTKRPRLSGGNGELLEKTLSEIFKNL
jgi:mediator of RNA polymerase II transcription subunit 27